VITSNRNTCNLFNRAGRLGNESPDDADECTCEEGGLSTTELVLIILFVVFLVVVGVVVALVCWKKHKKDDGF
jgi:hypothetical protein